MNWINLIILFAGSTLIYLLSLYTPFAVLMIACFLWGMVSGRYFPIRKEQ